MGIRNISKYLLNFLLSTLSVNSIISNAIRVHRKLRKLKSNGCQRSEKLRAP